MQFPQRINIHLCLNSTLLFEIKRINAILVKNGSEIDFSSKHVPHITLIMGVVNTLDNYNKIIFNLKNTLHHIGSFKIGLSSPYINQPSLKYVFIDVFPEKKIISLKHKLYNNIKELIELDPYGGPENNPHITIGYLQNYSEKIIEPLHLNISTSIVTKVGVSPTSNRGTCLDEYITIQLY